MGDREVRIDRDRTLEQRLRPRRPDDAYTCVAVVKAFNASNDAVVASWSGLEYFSMVTSDSPSRSRTWVAISLKRAEDIFFARHLRLLVGEDVAGGAVPRAQAEDVH